MAYLGKAPINGFHAKQQITGDGSTVTFTLDQTVATETSIIVSVGGVLVWDVSGPKCPPLVH